MLNLVKNNTTNSRENTLMLIECLPILRVQRYNNSITAAMCSLMDAYASPSFLDQNDGEAIKYVRWKNIG